MACSTNAIFCEPSAHDNRYATILSHNIRVPFDSKPSSKTLTAPMCLTTTNNIAPITDAENVAPTDVCGDE